MARVECGIFDLTPKHVFRIARGAKTAVRTVWVKLHAGGLTGLGEGAPQVFYGQTPESTLRAIKRFAGSLGDDLWQLEALDAKMNKILADEPSARCAIDLALHDLMGKRLKQPLWKLWGLDPARTPRTSFTIGIAPIDEMVMKLLEVPEYPIIKIKVGFKGDLETVAALRKAAPKKVMRVDANCGWDLKTAVTTIRKLEKYDVEYVEQPLPARKLAQMTVLKRKVGLPLVADESCQTVADIPNLRAGFDGINIKLTKCGGLREAMRMIHTARACSLKIMIGCMIESSILTTAAAQLGPLVDWLDVDGNLLITNDPARGVGCKRGQLTLPTAPGLGVRLV
ncbi:MAG TPA: dipeptide epimerase [Planctomycetota bacterium]|nr:dipeptide epimerase [Planctomycetota bacterium]